MPLSFQGVPGGPFTVYGANFGAPGLVHVGATQVTCTSWQKHRIKGLLPVGLNPKQDAQITDGTGKVTKIPYIAPAVPVSQNQPVVAK